MPQKHMWDQVADEIVSWIEGESDWYAAELMGNSPAPFSKELSEKEKQEYYESQMYKPDGSPNDAGRQQVLQRIGIENYIPLMQELDKKRTKPITEEPPMNVNPEEAIPPAGGY